MPQLDVSWVVEDPMFADTFDVIRRTDLVGNDGFTTPTAEETFPSIVGTITQQDPQDLMRSDAGQMVPRKILICTRFAIRGVSKDPSTGQQYQPDQIRWNGAVYTVVSPLAYSRYGGGLYEIVAESMNAVDSPDVQSPY